MQRARVVIATTIVTATLIGAWLAMSPHDSPTLAPAASIHLLSYRNFTMSNFDTNAFVYPGRGCWLNADMVLTNEGSVSISYGAWANEPYGWANVQTHQGTTNGYLAPHFTGGTAVLRPGCAAKFWVVLPTNTLQWQCGFGIETASVRDRAICRVLESRVSRLLPEVLLYPVRLLSNKTGPSVEVKSGLFEIEDNAESPHNESLHSTPR